MSITCDMKLATLYRSDGETLYSAWRPEQVYVTCDDPRCSVTEPAVFDRNGNELDSVYPPKGWTSPKDGEHRCPQHSPMTLAEAIAVLREDAAGILGAQPYRAAVAHVLEAAEAWESLP